MKYPVTIDLLPIAQTPLISPSIIIAHESGNPKNTGLDSLRNEVTYMKRNWSQAFVSHWVGAGGQIIQLARTGKVQWGAGPKANPYAYAQVELARTSDEKTFRKDYQAYIWLLKKLAAEAEIPCSLNKGTSLATKGIKTHSWITAYVGGTNHVDPDGYLKKWGISLSQFNADLEKSQVGSPFRPAFHQVRKGDTLWSLARTYQTTVAELMDLNQLHSSLIKVGQLLLLP